jgi:hypothetical protein
MVDPLCRACLNWRSYSLWQGQLSSTADRQAESGAISGNNASVALPLLRQWLEWRHDI